MARALVYRDRILPNAMMYNVPDNPQTGQTWAESPHAAAGLLQEAERLLIAAGETSIAWLTRRALDRHLRVYTFNGDRWERSYESGGIDFIGRDGNSAGWDSRTP